MQERICEVCRISGDGLRIILYKPHDTVVGDKPVPLPSRGADSIYSYENLPQKHHRKYVHASRFVALVRAQTAKVTIYTNKAKCSTMENTPNPNCDVQFYDNVRVSLANYYCVCKSKLLLLISLLKDVFDLFFH